MPAISDQNIQLNKHSRMTMCRSKINFRKKLQDRWMINNETASISLQKEEREANKYKNNEIP